MFVGYQVNTKGIKICPDKVDTVLSLQSPKFLKDVQKLREAEATFRQMKEHIAKLPMLTALEEQEELIVYLAASKEAHGRMDNSSSSDQPPYSDGRYSPLPDYLS
ncbi:hypothetical protein Tco_1418220 [Tanacetum coccineum]